MNITHLEEWKSNYKIIFSWHIIDINDKLAITIKK